MRMTSDIKHSIISFGVETRAKSFVRNLLQCVTQYFHVHIPDDYCESLNDVEVLFFPQT